MKEEFKSISGYEGLYEISNKGRVLSLLKKRFMKFFKDKDGYLLLNLTKENVSKKHRVHRLVAIEFLQNINNLPLVMHLDDNPSNNFSTNLKWGTIIDNIQDKIKKGRGNCSKGEIHKSAKLSKEQVLEIRNKHIPYEYTFSMLANEYGVSISCISGIISFRKWKNL